MATANAPRPKPVITINEDDRGDRLRTLIRLGPAVLLSILFHAGLLAAFFFLLMPRTAAEPEKEPAPPEAPVQAEPVVEEKKDPLLTADVDMAATEVDTDIQFNVDRKADVSVPGAVNPDEAVGIKDGDKSASPVTLPAPGGYGSGGQGGAMESFAGPGNSKAVGEMGGYGSRGLPLPGSFYGRSGATREMAWRNGGGTKESEACVVRGLKWLIRVQSPDGKWTLDHPSFKDRGQNNDIAATAFGLLPLLAAGKTHKPSKDNPYDKPIEKALAFLIRRQKRDPRSKNFGDFGGGMYAHGLATIAICEAYGLTQDPNLRRPAQMAVNYIIYAQHDAGGWRYGPKQAGDTSVSGWQVMALKSALMAGLDVPAVTLRRAQAYLDSCSGQNEGYGYTGSGSTPTMSAVGLLCRQYLQSWGPQNPRMIKGVSNHITKYRPSAMKNNCYYYYYATQVMHHFGGESWDRWNKEMRDILVSSQDRSSGIHQGSWTASGDAHGAAGGRLMITSMNLLTLEVYYRYLPLYYRESGAKKDSAVGKAL